MEYIEAFEGDPNNRTTVRPKKHRAYFNPNHIGQVPFPKRIKSDVELNQLRYHNPNSPYYGNINYKVD
jgi:hypothetical protein